MSAPARSAARGAAGAVRRDALIPAALNYADRGWHVFPIVPGGKRPAFPDHIADRCRGRDPRCRRAGRHVTWEERATTDPARIRTAWGAAPYGIGIACGPSGLVVIDLDTPKPDRDGHLPEPPEQWRPTVARGGVRDGADVFALVCDAAGQPVPWDTFATNTGRGGVHLYFTAPPSGDSGEASGARLRNTTGGTARSLGWLIDTRAAGGYVVAPPSVVEGRPYTVGHDGCPDHAGGAAPLPAWLTDALRPAPLPSQKPVTVALTAPHGHTAADTAGADEDRREAYLRAAVDRTLATIAAAEAGTRNRALYGAAVSLGQLVAGGELERDSTAAALEAAGVAVGQAPREAAATVRSGIRAGANRPRHITTHQGAAA